MGIFCPKFEKGELAQMEICENMVLFCTNRDQKWDVLRSVSVYRSAFRMISDESDYLEMDCFDESFCDWLKSSDEWESYGYIVLNGKNYVLFDSVSGDVLQAGTISDFVWASFEQYEKEKGE